MGEIGYEGRKGRDATGDSLFSGVHFGGGHGTLNEGWRIHIDFYRSQSTVLHNVLCLHNTLQSRFRYTRERTDTAGDISPILLHGPQT